MKNTIYTQVAVLTLILVSATALLAVTNNYTEPIIKENQKEEFNKKLREIFPDTEETENVNDDYYKVYDSQDKLLGYAVVSSEYGYQSDVKLLVGFEKKGKIDKIVILEQGETPGLGTKITRESFIDQFSGLTRESTTLSENGGEVDAISGATISSTAAVEAAKKSFEKFD